MHETTRLDQDRGQAAHVATQMASQSGGVMATGKANPAMAGRPVARARSMGAVHWKALALLAYDTTLVLFVVENLKRWFS